MAESMVTGIVDSMVTFALGLLVVFVAVALIAVAASNIAATFERFYAARYNREHWLTEIAKRKLMEERAALAEQIKTPEWEPVEDEDGENPPSDDREGGM